MTRRSSHALLELLRSRPVVELADICGALDGASRATAFRYLQQVPYRRSYNHNGCYYTLHDPTRYDRHGLFSRGDIHFSRDGTLKATVRRLVGESDAGWADRELRELLRVRVQPCLLDAVRKNEMARHRVGRSYVYVSAEPGVGETQLRHRQERLESAAQDKLDVCDRVVIEVLLVLVRHPSSSQGDVARRLQGRSPPIGLPSVHAVFVRYGLDEKRGLSTS